MKSYHVSCSDLNRMNFMWRLVTVRFLEARKLQWYSLIDIFRFENQRTSLWIVSFVDRLLILRKELQNALYLKRSRFVCRNLANYTGRFTVQILSLDDAVISSRDGRFILTSWIQNDNLEHHQWKSQSFPTKEQKERLAEMSSMWCRCSWEKIFFSSADGEETNSNWYRWA